MIVVVGLSHHTAAIDIREKMALSEADVDDLLGRLHGHPDVSEVFAVSTCNRVEVFSCASDDSEAGGARCAVALREELVRRCPAADPALYAHQGVEAVRHAVRVASSLDSLVVGEAQILGQMKKGFERARKISSVGPKLTQLFSAATRGAKRVRSETRIGEGQVSVPSIAVELAGQIFGELVGRRAVLVGAGEMGQTVARLLKDAGAELSVVGRSFERTAPVAAQVGGTAFLMEDLPSLLARADVVVSSTSAEHHILSRSELSERQKARNAQNLFLIDLAVPRDIDPAVGKLDSVFLYDVDDLSTVAQQSANSRQKEAQAGGEIVSQVVLDWERRSLAEQVTPTVKALRAKFRMGLEAELARSLKGRLKDLDAEQQSALSKMLDAGLNRILHEPITNLREEAARPNADGEIAAAVSEVFALSEVDSHELDVKAVRLPAADPPSSSRAPRLEGSPSPSSTRPLK